MGESKNNEEMEKGFVVKDRRFSAKKEAEGESKIKEQGKREEVKKEETPRQEIPLPEINFINFIFSLSTSALIQLGEIQDPLTQQRSRIFHWRNRR